VNDDIADTLAIEVETPTRLLHNPVNNPGVAIPYAGAVVVFDNLFEVFDRGTITPIASTTK